jgi:transposase
LLEKTLEVYPEGKSVIFLDNSSTHKAKALSPFLEENKDRIELVFLPPYSPDLNKIEELWRWIKADIMQNVFYESAEEITVNVIDFFKQRAGNLQEVLVRLCQ